MCLAIPGKIAVFVTDAPDLAVVEVMGVRRNVNVALLRDEPLAPGDWVLIHVGFAMSRISEEQAEAQIQTLRMLGEDQAAGEEIRGYGLSSGE